MSRLPFVKMHGAGNDYIFLDGFQTALPAELSELAQTLSCRHTGIGGDGLVTIQPAADDSCDAVMRMWNADGSQGLMCGNALRCVALRLYSHRPAARFRIRTATRDVSVTSLFVAEDDRSGEFSADLGTATPRTTQFCHRSDFPHLGDREDLPRRLTVHCLSVGNPHAVVFTEHLSDSLVHDFGAAVSSWSRFPDGSNVEWVQTVGDNHVRVRVWERGSGETLACGSGACAVVAAGVQLGRFPAEQDIRVELPGGILCVRQDAAGRLQLQGPAAVVFEGTWRGTATSGQSQLQQD